MHDDFYGDSKPKKQVVPVTRQDSDQGFGNMNEEIIDEDPFNNTGGNKRFEEIPFEEEIIDEDVDFRKKNASKTNNKKPLTDDSFNKTNPKHFNRMDTKSKD